MAKKRARIAYTTLGQMDCIDQHTFRNNKESKTS